MEIFMKHTPGPWGCVYTSFHAHDYRLTKPNGETLPINAPCNDRSEQRANERLIAAAPDLLEALEHVSNSPEFKHLFSATQKLVLLAVIKATGE
jgi:hypothetical protein